MEYKYEAIFCIVNSGYSETVMEVAKSVGAGGGTVINARGTANKEAETFFHITIDPEKEIVMILVPKKLKDPLLRGLYKTVGLDSPGQGIAFSVPVEQAVGLSERKPAEQKETKE
jgi:nitrogen regulatory protein PII